MPFSVGSYITIINGTWYDRVHISGVPQGRWKPVTFTDCHLVDTEDFIHHESCNMSPTLEVFCCLLLTYLAAFHWTISILFMLVLRWRSHTELTYSSVWLKIGKPVLMEVESMFKLWCKKQRVLLALPQMLLMWFSHLR
jgi:hypothetical protein